ncbi:hypothetical protein [Roseicyclus elongatus]|uniref:hypothetical protein n=1 Tax=Roseicyclus elongatus TaxID=159346 RepID=UPI0004B3451C|nr:hypothetical protein [Roseibacterium elongatum]
MTSIEMYRPGIDEVKGNLAWSALEHRLLDCCQTGAPAGLPGKTDLPPDCSDPDRRVRAGLIRYLMLGGCDRPRGARPHPNGVRIMGGWIDGVLDLESCQSPLAYGCKIASCRSAPIFMPRVSGRCSCPAAPRRRGWTCNN